MNNDTLRYILGSFMILLSGSVGFFILDVAKSTYLKKYQSVLMMIGASLVAFFMISALRFTTGLIVGGVVGFLIYAFLTDYFLKKQGYQLNAFVIIMLVISGQLCLETPVRMNNFNSSLFSLPSSVMNIMGAFAGYFFYQRTKLLAKINLALSVLVLGFVCSYGFDLWCYKINYGTFTGEVHVKKPKVFAAVLTKNNRQVDFNNGKYTVLDFWFIGCGSCINDFPHFQEAYSSYRNNPNVQFYAVNVPTSRETTIDPFDFLTKRKYNFPMVVNTDGRLADDLKVTVYPTVIILDKKGDIIYKGDSEGVNNKLRSLL